MPDRYACRHHATTLTRRGHVCDSCDLVLPAIPTPEDEDRRELARLRDELNAMHAYADLLEEYIGRVHALLDSVQRGRRLDSHAEPYTRGMAQGIFVLAQRIRINLPDPRHEERKR